MIGGLWLVALLLGLDQPPVPLDLATIGVRARELGGQWVEFDAYVGGAGSPRFPGLVMAIPGERRTLPNGATKTVCGGTRQNNLPVLVSQGSDKVLHRVAKLKQANVVRLPKARVKAIFHNAPYEIYWHPVTYDTPGYFDHATMTLIAGDTCRTNI